MENMFSHDRLALFFAYPPLIPNNISIPFFRYQLNSYLDHLATVYEICTATADNPLAQINVNFFSRAFIHEFSPPCG